MKQTGIVRVLVLLLVLAALVAIAIYFYTRIKTVDLVNLPPPPEAIESMTQAIKPRPGDAILKSPLDGQTSVMYEIIGSFAPGVALNHGLITGSFQLAGDPTGQQMLVMLGRRDQQINLGVYQGNWSNTSSWSTQPLAVVGCG